MFDVVFQQNKSLTLYIGTGTIGILTDDVLLEYSDSAKRFSWDRRMAFGDGTHWYTYAEDGDISS